EEAARAMEPEARRQAAARRAPEPEEGDGRAREAEKVRKPQQQEVHREQGPEQRHQTGSSKRSAVVAVAISPASGVGSIWLAFFFLREGPNPARLQAAGPAPQTPAPTEAAPRLAELTARERQTYDAARGNVVALRAYVNGCTVCAYEGAARGEIGRL